MKLSQRAISRILLICLGLVLLAITLTVVLIVSGRVSNSAHHVTSSPTTSAGPTSPGSPASASSDNDNEDETPGADDQAEIYSVVRSFVSLAFSMNYKDAPGVITTRVAPYIAPNFIGALPQLPSRTSSAGQQFYGNETASVATVGKPSDLAYDLTSPDRVVVNVTFTIATSFDGRGSSSLTYDRRLTLVEIRGKWLVNEMDEGVYGG